MERTAGMTAKKKLGSALAALALMVGAVPGTVGMASAIETGQMLDKGPKWPHKTYPYVQIVVIIASLVGLIAVLSKNKDAPASP
jgi:hypothetical protein